MATVGIDLLSSGKRCLHRSTAVSSRACLPITLSTTAHSNSTIRRKGLAINQRLVHRLGLLAALAATWILVIVRVQPWPFSDYMVFLAVARRLSAGDRLYEEIWDNKDPFVYYSLAALQDLGQPALWAFEVMWLVIAGACVFGIARHFMLSRNWAVFVGGVLTPITLISYHYFPGTTHLPGVSLTLLTLLFVLQSRYTWGGVTLGLLFFFKLSMLPLALIAIGVVVVSRRSLHSLIRMSLATLMVLAVSIVVLALRDELIPYLGSLSHNFTYSQTNAGSGETGIAAAMGERLSVLSDAHVLIALVTLVSVLGYSWLRDVPRQLWLLSASTFAGGLILTVAIGKFPHHAQVFGVSATLALVAFVLALGDFRAKAILAAALGLLISLGLAGGPSTQGYRNAVLNPQGTWQAMTTTDAATRDLLSSGPPRSFAVLQGAGIPRSAGLEDWDLACRHIAQRPWESDRLLNESLECFPRAEVLLVPLEQGIPESPVAFNKFLTSVRELVAQNYRCFEGEENLVCERRAPQD